MEMVHPYPSSNFYSNYGNFNAYQNDNSTFHHLNNNSSNNNNNNSNNNSNNGNNNNNNGYSNNRIFGNSSNNKTTNKNLDSNFNFSTLIKSGFGRHDSAPSNLDQLDRTTDHFIEFKHGMQDVPGWLKSLRLHKYKLIFSELSYDEMLSLTEQQLEEKNVTKGARHKIIVNIDKLRARQSNVIGMEKTIEHEGLSGVRQCLNEIKAMLLTPIKAFESDNECKDTYNQDVAEGDLPSQIMKLLEKVFNVCLQNESMRDDEIINLYLSNCDKVLSHEAFTAFHKQRLLKIKSKLEPFRFANQLSKNGIDPKVNKMKWNNTMPSMPLNHLQNINLFNHKNNSSNNSSLNSNYHSQNSFSNNSQYNSNSSLNNLQHYQHPFHQNGTRFNASNNSNYNTQPPPPQANHFFNKMNCKPLPLNLVSSNHLQNHVNNFMNQKINNVSKSNEPYHKFNVNAECFTTSRPKTMFEINNLKNGNVARKSSTNENVQQRKLSGNRFMLGGERLGKYSQACDEYEKQTNTTLKQHDTNSSSAKIVAPLSSCSLFNACSQIGKFNKLNSHLNSYDKLNGLDSGGLKQSNQFIFNNLLNDPALMKCLENNSSLTNSSVFSHDKLASNYETDDFDDKDLLDENHQIYNHIELLSLRMTEQALGSSEFS